jgi:hypothetical protein
MISTITGSVVISVLVVFILLYLIIKTILKKYIGLDVTISSLLELYKNK